MREVVFKFEFTPAVPCNYWSAEKKAKWARERAFYSCQANFDYLSYILNKAKTGEDNDKLLKNIDNAVTLAQRLNPQSMDRHKAKSIEEYISRGGSLGVFDLNGDLTAKQMEEYHNGARQTGSIIWHGWISFDEVTSKGVNYEAAKKFMAQTFGIFLKKSGFKPDNLAIMCALHTDKEHHHHIHYSFYEKTPKYRTKNGKVGYRNYGVVSERQMTDYRISAAAHMDENRDEYYSRRDRALDRLKHLRREPMTDGELTEKLMALARKLPVKGRLQYNSPNISPFRDEIDDVALCFLRSNPDAWQAHKDVMTEIARKEYEIKQLAGGERSDYVKGLNNDYKSRLGNQILGLVKRIRFDPKRLDKSNRVGERSLTDRQKKASSRRQYCVGARIVRDFIRSLDTFQANIRADFTREMERAEREIEQQQQSNG